MQPSADGFAAIGTVWRNTYNRHLDDNSPIPYSRYIYLHHTPAIFRSSTYARERAVGYESWDVVIVGAGPSGLAASLSANNGNKRILVVDSGKPLTGREPSIPSDLTQGAGGAGLFSDGKFSFYPAATALWRLIPAPQLTAAYAAICHILKDHGMEIPSPLIHEPAQRIAESALYVPKRYPSRYLSLQQRIRLIEALQETEAEYMFETTVTRIEATHEQVLILSLRTRSGLEFAVTSRAVILATGRFGPASCLLDFPHRRRYRRVEVGVRIEQPAEKFFLRDDEYLDSKYICVDRSVQRDWRTFCCCRQGRVLTTEFSAWTTVSGTADCPPTGWSNVGLNVRIMDQEHGHEVLCQIRESMDGRRIMRTSLEEALEPDSVSLANRLGTRGAAEIQKGLYTLVKDFGGDRFQEATLHAPSVEGLGEYPEGDAGLRLSPYPIWAPGDMSGVFRGLVAALVSGHFVGAQARRWVEEGGKGG